MALGSPHFRSKRPSEEFDMMVLESKPLPGEPRTAALRRNATRTIAIDEFPAMDEAAIEQFWIRKVEDRRQRRRELFASWEKGRSTDQPAAEPPAVTKKKKHVKKSTLSLDELANMSTQQLRTLLTSPVSTPELREAVAVVLDERLDRLERLEKQLHEQEVTDNRDEL